MSFLENCFTNTQQVQAKDFVGVKRRQNESGVLRGGKSSQEIKPHRIVSLQKSLWICWE